MKRLLFHLAVAVSLLLWLFAVVAGVFELRGLNSGYSFAWKLGGTRQPTTSSWNARSTVTLEFAGFKEMESVDVYDRPIRVIMFPHWVGMILFAIVPTIAIKSALRNRAARRRLLGLCRHCGYDLRATPDRCPECGALPVAAASTDL